MSSRQSGRSRRPGMVALGLAVVGAAGVRFAAATSQAALYDVACCDRPAGCDRANFNGTDASTYAWNEVGSGIALEQIAIEGEKR